MLYLAIDQHSKQLTVNVRDEAGNVLRRKQVSTRPEATREFLEELRQQARPGGYVTIVEVCGFNDWLLDLLPQCGCREIVLVQPAQRAIRKTDRRDANQLGETLWVNRQRLLAGERVNGLRRVTIPSPTERDNRRLAALRRSTGRELTRVLNRVRALLRRQNLQHACPTKSIQSQAARAWLKELPLSPLDRFERDQLLERWELLARQRTALETELTRRADASPAAALLRTLPGAGAFIALGLAAHVGDVRRFDRPRSLANYLGLTPQCHNTGESGQRLGSITKQGSSLARFLLGQLVLHVLKKDAVMRAWYVQLKRRRGSKIAQVAVMRRLATIVWHLLTRGESYRIGGRPRGAATPQPASLPSETQPVPPRRVKKSAPKSAGKKKSAPKSTRRTKPSRTLGDDAPS